MVGNPWPEKTQKTLDVRYDPNTPDSWWLLSEHWRETTLPDGTRRLVWVPAGFETDIASIPQVLQGWLPRWGRYASASVVHDWLYANRLGTRKMADKIFFCIMRDDGVDAVTRKQMYLAVRAFGGPVWDND